MPDEAETKATPTVQSTEIKETVFHSKDGLAFIRFDGGQFHGSVQLCKIHPDGARQMLAEWLPAEWASIVATMSALGETGTTFRMFEALQK